LFLVLLRVAIGWHFLYEGVEKVESTRKGGKPFSAEVYLRNSTGPLAPRFRAMVPDVNSLHKLNRDDLKTSWAADVEQIANHYHFDQKQRQEAQRELADADKNAEIWFLDKETTEKRNKYFNELREVQRVERDPNALSYERERAASRRKDLDVDRKALTADLDSWGSVLREAVIKLATPEQRESAGPTSRRGTSSTGSTWRRCGA